jgi:hypothetical protein
MLATSFHKFSKSRIATMPERKNHQDSEEYGGLPFRFKMSLPTFSIASDSAGRCRFHFRGVWAL